MCEIYSPAVSEVSSILRATGEFNTKGWAAEKSSRVETTTVDLLLESATRPFLKLDLQGYELEALEGASATLAIAPAVEVELSTVELYAGAPLLPEVLAFLDRKGYELFSCEPALVDYESARVLQLDGLFIRRA